MRYIAAALLIATAAWGQVDQQDPVFIETVEPQVIANLKTLLGGDSWKEFYSYATYSTRENATRFVQAEGEKVLIPYDEYLARIYCVLQPEWLRQYRLETDAKAERDLAAATRSGNLAQINSLCRQYLANSSADDACVKCISSFLNQGSIEDAISLLKVSLKHCPNSDANFQIPISRLLYYSYLERDKDGIAALKQLTPDAMLGKQVAFAGCRVPLSNLFDFFAAGIGYEKQFAIAAIAAQVPGFEFLQKRRLFEIAHLVSGLRSRRVAEGRPDITTQMPGGADEPFTKENILPDIQAARYETEWKGSLNTRTGAREVTPLIEPYLDDSGPKPRIFSQNGTTLMCIDPNVVMVESNKRSGLLWKKTFTFEQNANNQFINAFSGIAQYGVAVKDGVLFANVVSASKEVGSGPIPAKLVAISLAKRGEVLSSTDEIFTEMQKGQASPEFLSSGYLYLTPPIVYGDSVLCIAYSARGNEVSSYLLCFSFRQNQLKMAWWTYLSSVSASVFVGVPAVHIAEDNAIVCANLGTIAYVGLKDGKVLRFIKYKRQAGSIAIRRNDWSQGEVPTRMRASIVKLQSKFYALPTDSASVVTFSPAIDSIEEITSFDIPSTYSKESKLNVADIAQIKRGPGAELAFLGGGGVIAGITRTSTVSPFCIFYNPNANAFHIYKDMDSTSASASTPFVLISSNERNTVVGATISGSYSVHAIASYIINEKGRRSMMIRSRMTIPVESYMSVSRLGDVFVAASPTSIRVFQSFEWLVWSYGFTGGVVMQTPQKAEELVELACSAASTDVDRAAIYLETGERAYDLLAALSKDSPDIEHLRVDASGRIGRAYATIARRLLPAEAIKGTRPMPAEPVINNSIYFFKKALQFTTDTNGKKEIVKQLSEALIALKRYQEAMDLALNEKDTELKLEKQERKDILDLIRKNAPQEIEKFIKERIIPAIDKATSAVDIKKLFDSFPSEQLLDEIIKKFDDIEKWKKAMKSFWENFYIFPDLMMFGIAGGDAEEIAYASWDIFEISEMVRRGNPALYNARLCWEYIRGQQKRGNVGVAENEGRFLAQNYPDFMVTTDGGKTVRAADLFGVGGKPTANPPARVDLVKSKTYAGARIIGTFGPDGSVAFPVVGFYSAGKIMIFDLEKSAEVGTVAYPGIYCPLVFSGIGEGGNGIVLRNTNPEIRDFESRTLIAHKIGAPGLAKVPATPSAWNAMKFDSRGRTGPDGRYSITIEFGGKEKTYDLVSDAEAGFVPLPVNVYRTTEGNYVVVWSDCAACYSPDLKSMIWKYFPRLGEILDSCYSRGRLVFVEGAHQYNTNTQYLDSRQGDVTTGEFLIYGVTGIRDDTGEVTSEIQARGGGGVEPASGQLELMQTTSIFALATDISYDLLLLLGNKSLSLNMNTRKVTPLEMQFVVFQKDILHVDRYWGAVYVVPPGFQSDLAARVVRISTTGSLKPIVEIPPQRVQEAGSQVSFKLVRGPTNYGFFGLTKQFEVMRFMNNENPAEATNPAIQSKIAAAFNGKFSIQSLDALSVEAGKFAVVSAKFNDADRYGFIVCMQPNLDGVVWHSPTLAAESSGIELFVAADGVWLLQTQTSIFDRTASVICFYNNSGVMKKYIELPYDIRVFKAGNALVTESSDGVTLYDWK